MEATVSICDRNRIAGKRFGRLVVVGQTTKYKVYPRGRSSFLWECRCDCGGTAYAERDKLLKGHTVSCGCLKEERDTQNIKCGQRFGRLVAACRTSRTTKNRDRLWKFQCDCGKVKFLPTNQVTSGNTQSCGCLRREIETANLRASVDQLKKETDLTGQRIGLLEVVGVEGQCSLKHRLYRCLCKCGNIRIARRKDLLRRKYSAKTAYPKSCGCRGKGLIERYGDQWRMISTGEIVPLDLHEDWQP